MAEKRAEATSDRQESQARQQDQARHQGEANREQRQPAQGQARQQSSLARRQPSLIVSPFVLLERLADEMAGIFDRPVRGMQPSQSTDFAAGMTPWAPKVDVFQRGNELIIRADVPGVNPDDVVVEVSDDAVTISGERRQEHEEDQGGVYRFERTYGSFLRVIPLPDGAIVDRAKANFKDGVLEIAVPAPPEQVSRGRRVEISRGEERGDEATQGGQQRQDRPGSQGSQSEGRR